MLNSGGGILEAAIKIVGIIRTYANEFEVIVPFMAKGAATIIALKADRLYLTPVSELGPVDPVVQSPTNRAVRVPAQAIRQFIDQYGSQLQKNPDHCKIDVNVSGELSDKNPLDEIIISKLNITIDPYILGAYQAAKEFTEGELIERLEKYKITGSELVKAEQLFLGKKSHAYPILLTDLSTFGIGELIEMKTISRADVRRYLNNLCRVRIFMSAAIVWKPALSYGHLENALL